jgi:hypothetical protein
MDTRSGVSDFGPQAVNPRANARTAAKANARAAVQTGMTDNAVIPVLFLLIVLSLKKEIHKKERHSIGN